MQYLPTELRIAVLSLLAHDDLAAMARVSREWSTLVQDEHVWQMTFARRFAHRWDQPPLTVPVAARQAYRISLAAFRRYSPIAQDTHTRLIDVLENTKAWSQIQVPPYHIDDLHPEVKVYEHFISTKEEISSHVSVIYHTSAMMPLPLDDLAALLLDVQNRRSWDVSLTDVRVLAALDAFHDVILSRHRDGAEFCCLRHVQRTPGSVVIASASIDEDENGYFAVPPPSLANPMSYKRLIVRPSGFRLQRISQGKTLLSSVLQLPRLLDRLTASQTFAVHRIRLLHNLVQSPSR